MRLDLPFARNNRLLRGVVFAGSLVVVLAVLFRKQLWTGFGFVFGDRNDAVIEAALLEHWFNVAKGAARWNEVYFFYPYRDGLGYNDGYFLYGLIYSLIRGAGADSLLASDLVNAVVKAVGFAAFFVASRRLLRLSRGWSLFGAALFSLSYNNFVHAGHAQLLTVALAPVMALLLLQTFEALRARDDVRTMLWGCASGLIYGAWVLTGYYMAWFFAFFSAFLAAAALGLSADGRRFFSSLRAQALPLFVAGLVWILALVPALLVYMPKARETGMRGWVEASQFAIPPIDILNFGHGDYLFGGLYARTIAWICRDCSLANSEFTTGFTPVLFALFVASCIWLARRRENANPLVIALAAAAVVSWLFCIRIGHFTPWRFVYDWVPGAKALRVVSRYQLFLTAPVVGVTVSFLAHHVRSISVAAIIGAVLLLEQLGTGPVGLDRKAELQRVTVDRPPSGCTSFFATEAPDQWTASGHYRNLLPHNVDAMMIAELHQIPTINGFASFNPPDWNFADPELSDYPERVRRYADRHDLRGLCRLDLKTHRWTGPRE